MTDSTEEMDERRFVSSIEHRATPGREAGVVLTFLANRDFFVRFAENMFFWQIMFCQIVVGKLCVGKSHFGKLHFGKLLPTPFILGIFEKNNFIFCIQLTKSSQDVQNI